MSRFYRWHSKLKASVDGPVVNRQLLHLKQGELDGACGTHCALMALMMFGIIRRDELEDISKVRKKPLSKLWTRTAPFYFIGINAHQLKSVFSPYEDQLSCQVLGKDLIEQTIERLKTGGVCIVAINNADFKHWVLVVGYGGKSWDKGGSADTLLILDPDVPPLPMLPWNSTLIVKPNKNGQHRYDATDGSVNVSIDSVLALKLRLIEKSNTRAGFNLSTSSSTINPISPAESQADNDAEIGVEPELEDEADFDPDVEFGSESESESESDFESDFDFDLEDEDDSAFDPTEIGTEAENDTASTDKLS